MQFALFADSIDLIMGNWKNQMSYLVKVQNGRLNSVYIGASNGDVKEFFEMFCLIMEVR
jgi:hypothetical protein